MYIVVYMSGMVGIQVRYGWCIGTSIGLLAIDRSIQGVYSGYMSGMVGIQVRYGRSGRSI